MRHGANSVLQSRPNMTTVCVDAAMMGVGGINSWGAPPLPQHRIPGGVPTRWSFRLRPFGSGDSPPSEIARAEPTGLPPPRLVMELYMVNSGAVQAAISCEGAKKGKVLHVVRHAQGYHNLPGADVRSDECLDAKLTPQGHEQCAALAQITSGAACAWTAEGTQLVVSSPLTRTLDTAKRSFPAQLAQASTPFIAHEAIRETVNFACDARRPLEEIQKEFPEADFANCDWSRKGSATGDGGGGDGGGGGGGGADRIWKEMEGRFGPADTHRRSRESTVPGAVLDRAQSFVHWMAARKETEIAVVSHSAFLNTVLNYGYETPKKNTPKTAVRGVGLGPPGTDGVREGVPRQPLVRYGNEACRAYMQAPWENCEMRSVVAFFVRDE